MKGLLINFKPGRHSKWHSMHPQKKRNRQTIRRTAVNRIRVGRIRSTIREVESAIVSGDKTKAQAALKVAQPIIMSGVSKGVLKHTTASRKMSRLSARVKAIGSTA